MRIYITKNYEEMSKKTANIIASQVILKPNSILGLATGSTPIGTYKELIRMYQEGDVNFSQVVTFNLDEYYGLGPSDEQSYHYFMTQQLFQHINIKQENIHIPNGKAEDVEAECNNYEEMIEKAGRIDLQLLGIGTNGHIGFNEPNVKFESSTHLVDLDEKTIKSNSRFFNSIDEVPTKAISMGIKTIMKAKKILLAANGEGKAQVIYDMINGPITPELPASILQLHPDVTIIVDEEAGALIQQQNKDVK